MRAEPLRPIWYYPEPELKEEIAPSAPEPKVLRPQTDYVVQKGDTLCGIARRFKLSLQELIEENHLGKGVPIYPGQRIILPGVQIDALEALAIDGKYTVRPGDTLFKIAQRHATTVASLKSVNHLRNDRILVGKVLKIPSQAETAAACSASRKTEFIKHKDPAPLAQAYSDANGSYTVKRGDSLFSIAKKTGTTFSELQELNHISDPKNLQIGQKLLIHPAGPSTETTFTETTQALETVGCIPTTSGNVASRAPQSSYTRLMEDPDFFKEDIDAIPVVQVCPEG
ncbi:MAG: LysM peptidoglycan-binding domain-containing protein [Puniceicoccales bacterium]|nr:LysM peptidoglycan-binding domain-containing protein [Puniceicoccales bacterium]